MNILEAIRIALVSLATNRLRTGLAALGIVIGVGCIITMVAVGEGVRKQILEQVQALGTNVLTMFGGRGGGRIGGAMGAQQPLTLEDVEAVRTQVPDVVRVAPMVQRSAQVVYQNKNLNSPVMGVTQDFLAVRDFKVAAGRFFTEAEQKSLAKVCVLGSGVCNELFGESDAVGKNIRMNSIQFRVVGVFKEKGAVSFVSPDDMVFVPLQTAMMRLFEVRNLSMVSVEVSSMPRMAEAQTALDDLIRKRHRIREGVDSDVFILSQAEFIASANAMATALTMLLGSIAGVSLLVGGIGIMNIMLVTVTERTREIGVRKAVGARRTDILLQFLIEAAALSLVGGMIGIVLGYTGAVGLAKIAGWKTVVRLYSVVGAAIFSAGVGVFFGILPARRAASLDPIEALRYE